MPLKIRRIEHQNRWSYEQIDRVLVVDESSPILLETNRRETRMWPLPDGDGHVEWAMIEDFEDDLKPGVRSPEEIWVQIGYTIFSSHRAGDDARISRLRKVIKKKGLGAIPFPPEMRPKEACVGTMNDAFHTLRLEGDVGEGPYFALFVSEPSDLPTINDHTIPEEELSFHWITVSVTTYGPIRTAPTYGEVLERLRSYRACFEGLIDPV